MRQIKFIAKVAALLNIALFAGQLAALPTKPTVQARLSLKNVALVNRSEINADSLIKSDCSDIIRGKLAGIQLGHIPDPLGELVLEKKELQQKLGKFAQHIDLPEKVIIKRQGAILKGHEVSSYIKALCNPLNEKEIEVDTSRIPTNIVLPGNLQDWEIKANSENRLGMRLFSLTAKTDGGNFRQLIQVNVAKVIEAAQLTRLARPGELITNDMVRKKAVEVKTEQANLPIKFKEVIGKCLGRFKSSGTILRSSDISEGERNICLQRNSKTRKKPHKKAKPRVNQRSLWVVNPGDQVQYVFSSGSLAMTFPAKAIEGGEVGDSIRLINLRTKKRIKGTITDKGQVEYAQN